MNDQTAEKYIDSLYTVMPELNGLPLPSDFRRQLRLLIKEVDRDTRHRACEIMQGACGDIHNMDRP